MADQFEPSPRPSKRQKTYAIDRSILKSPRNSSRFSSVTNSLYSLGSSLFDRLSAQKPEAVHDDSAYGSKEDSFNEDDVGSVAEEPEAETAATEAVKGMQEKSSRRSTRGGAQQTAEEPEEASVSNHDTPARSLKSTKTRKSVGSTPASVDTSITRRSSRMSQGAAVEVPSETTYPSTSKTSQKSVRQNPILAAPEEGQSMCEEVDVNDEPSKRAAMTNTATSSPIPGSKSTGRLKRKPDHSASKSISETEKREPTQPAATAKAISNLASPPPKGILTPSKRRGNGPRKSVVFDDYGKEAEEQFGFKDIDTSTTKPHPASTSEAVVRDEIPDTPPDPLLEDENLFFNQQVPQDMLQSLTVPSFVPRAVHDDSSTIANVKTLVLARLTSSTTPTEPLPHLETQYKSFHALLTSTITAGESNSLLLLGNRGSGKTSLINIALADLTAKHQSDFHTVKLNGFFQTDDRLALREIWRQLGRERELQGEIDSDEMGQVGESYADTMASLLSLLSHPDEFDITDVMDLDAPSIEQNRTSKSVIIILEEFDQFTLHPRQTLLYNLFDIAQSKKAPIAVIGTSTRMDVVDLLEKRVKSRFSHRWLHVPSMSSVESFTELLKSLLTVGSDDLVSQGVHMQDLDADEEELQLWNKHIEVSLPLQFLGS
jgi:origin recognition complex subunit 4